MSTSKRIGEILVSAGILDEKKLAKVVEENANHAGELLGETAVRLGFAKDKDIAQAISTQLGFPLVDLVATSVDPHA
ncbi:MAG: type II secretion system protein GspE, partial [Planctomycetes bacterium]|nr:type II secretion system protein GspE [Planctomycetota bacterium]